MANDCLRLPDHQHKPRVSAAPSEWTRRTPQQEELSADLDGIETALLAWNRVYEQVRPHQAPGYKTREGFYQDWLTMHHTAKEALSDMS